MNASANRCILSPLGDSVFFVGMPLAILGVFAVAQEFGFALLLAALVMSSLSMGHHLPGFLRVYMDPELFRRYRLRFLFIPPLLATAAIALAAYDFKTLAFILFFWGVWHGLMQVYGFARIYDAKIGDISPRSAWLDWMLCVSWFATLTLTSFREVNLRHYADQVGLGFLAELLLAKPLLDALVGGTALVSGAFLANLGWRLLSGLPVNPFKLAMLATTMLLLFVSYRNFAGSPLVSLALFEAYHDVQYFAIVWSFGRKQSDRQALSKLGSVLFRPRMVFVYVAIILLYGSLDSPIRYLAEGQLLRPITALVSVSTVLHFYFDGFIWKIRKRTIQVDSPASQPTSPTGVDAGWRDLAVQLALLGAPIGVLVLLQVNRSRFEMPLLDAVTSIVPATPDSEFALARLAARYGQTERATAIYERVVTAKPNSKDAWYNLGVLHLRNEKFAEAETAFRQAIKADPTFSFGYLQLATILRQSNRGAEAVQVLDEAQKQLPQDPAILSSLADALASKSDRTPEDLQRAVGFAERATQVSRGDAVCESKAALATIYRMAGRNEDARKTGEEAMRLAQAAKDPQLRRRITQAVSQL